LNYYNWSAATADIGSHWDGKKITKGLPKSLIADGFSHGDVALTIRNVSSALREAGSAQALEELFQMGSDVVRCKKDRKNTYCNLHSVHFCHKLADSVSYPSLLGRGFLLNTPEGKVDKGNYVTVKPGSVRVDLIMYLKKDNERGFQAYYKRWGVWQSVNAILDVLGPAIEGRKRMANRNARDDRYRVFQEGERLAHKNKADRLARNSRQKARSEGKNVKGTKRVSKRNAVPKPGMKRIRRTKTVKKKTVRRMRPATVTGRNAMRLVRRPSHEAA